MQTYLKDLRWGKFNLIKGDFISDISSYYGEWSDVEVAIFHQLLNENSNIVEVGSNIGMHAVPLAKKVPQGRLICFEPQRIIFQQLCCNLALNNLTNVETYQLGVGDQLEEMTVEATDYETPWNYGSFSLDRSFSTESHFNGCTTQEEISVITLDQFRPIQRLSHLTLLKIDAEGFDIKVLRGAERTIARFQPFIFIEVHHHSVDSTLAELDRLGYQAYWVASRRYQADNFHHVAEAEQGLDINLLAIPKQSEYNFAQHSTAQHSTAQHSTAQHSTAQHSTAQQYYVNCLLH